MILNFHGNHHLGDTLISFIPLYNASNYFNENNITINFYMRPEHIEQMNYFKPTNNFNIYDISKKPNNSFEIWDCNDYIFEPNRKQNVSSRIHCGLSQNRYYLFYFNLIYKKLNIPISMKNFCYEDDDLLDKYNLLNDKYKNIDILIINSLPLSKQYNYDENDWNKFIKKINKKYKIVTTKKVDDVLCTRDDNFNVKYIASIATHSKVVISINTGPMIALLNKYILKNVKKFYIFDNRCYYNYPNFINNKNSNINTISISELVKIINE